MDRNGSLLLFVSLFPFFWMLRTALSSNADLVKWSQTPTPPRVRRG